MTDCNSKVIAHILCIFANPLPVIPRSEGILIMLNGKHECYDSRSHDIASLDDKQSNSLLRKPPAFPTK